MADYKISIGAELRTKDIDTAVKNYKGEVTLKTKLDTDGITTALNGYKAPNPIEVNSRLNTQGITDDITKYSNKQNRKKISVDIDPKFTGVGTELEGYSARSDAKKLKVEIDLDPTSIVREIKSFSTDEKVKIGISLDDNAVSSAINELNATINKAESKTKIEVGVEPVFDNVEAKIKTYTPRTLIKVNAKLNKNQIDNSIKNFNTGATLKINNVALTESAIKKAMTLYNPEAPVPVKVDFVLGSTTEVDNKINAYKTTPVPISAKLVKSVKGFTTDITKDPVYIEAELKTDAINNAILNPPKNLGKIPIDVKLVPKDINGQIKQLPKPTEPLNVQVELNEASVNNAITGSKHTALLDVGIKLDDDNINAQIEAVKPSAKIKVDVDLNNNDINKDASSQPPILVNIKLDREKINEQIRNFKTKTKIKVGVKLDFASHEGGQKGIPQQIKDYKTSSKIKVGVELDKDSIAQEINNINTSTGAPIQLGVELNPNGVRRIHDQIDNIRQRLQNLGNITINLNPPVNNGGGGNGAGGNVVGNIDAIRAHINNARSDIADFRRSLASMDFDRNTIAAVTRDLERLDLTVTDVTSTFRNNRLTVAVDGIDQAQRAVTVIKEYNEVGQHLNTTTRIRQSFGEDAEAARQLEERLSRLKAIATQMGNLEVDIFKLRDNPNAHVNEIAALESQLNSLRATYQRLSSEIDFNQLTGRQALELSASFEKTRNELDRLEAAFIDTRAKLANKIEIELNEGKFAAQVTKVSSDAKKLSGNYVELRTKLDILKNAEKDMNSAFNNGTIEQRIQAYKNYEAALSSVENQLKQNKIAEKDSLDAVALDQARDKLSFDIDNWLKDNSAAAKDFGARLREIQSAVKTADNASLKRLRAEFVNIKKEAQLAGKTTQTFADRLKTQFSKYSQYLSIASLFMYAEQGMRDMFRQVVAIDTAMTELKKVTDETDASYNKFLTNAASRARELGTTIDGLVTSAADFARLGYGFEDAQGLAEVANIYAVVGDEIEGVEDATQSLVSTLAAFKSEMGSMSDSDFAMSIVDKMNEVSNNFAISSGGIGQALQRSASSMAAANNSLDETIAMIAAANTVAQNPEKVGNAFKTMSMRIRGAKTELEEAGESTEGMAESTASLRQEMIALSGVDIMLNDNEFKSTYQIMDELSAKWKDLTDIQQATITELVAGKHQGNIMASLMTNFDTAREALDTSLNSAGSAMEEHAKWSQSLEARLNKLKAAWQGLAQSFMSSDFLKVAIDSIIALTDGIGSLIDTFGMLPTLVGAFTAFESFKGGGFFKTIRDEATGTAIGITNAFTDIRRQAGRIFMDMGIGTNAEFRNSLQSDVQALSNYKVAVQGGMSKTEAFSSYMDNASESAKAYANANKAATLDVTKFINQEKAAQVTLNASNKSMASAKAIMAEYNNGCKNTAMTQTDFVSAVGKGNPELGKYLSNLNGAKAGLAGYVTSLVGAKVASIALQVATTALNMALTMGISALITWGISKLDEWIETADELAERIGNVTSEYEEQHKTLMKMKGNFDTSNEDSLISKYGELSKGVDKFGENLSLTADEYAEYQSIVNTIADQLPSIVSGYNSQGDAILECAGDVDKLTESYRELIKEQNSEVLKNGSDIFKDFKNNLKETSAYYQTTKSKSVGKGYRNEYLDNYDLKHLDKLEELMNLDSDKLDGYIANLSSVEIERISKLLDEQGIERNLLGSGDAGWETQREHIIRALGKDKKEIKKVLDDAAADLNKYAEELGTVTEAYFSDAFLGDYANMSDRMQNIITQVTSGFGSEFYADFLNKENPYEELTKYYDSLLTSFDSLSGASKNKLEATFDLKTQFNGGDINYGEYISNLREANSLIGGMTGIDDDIKAQLKLNLNTDEAIKEYDYLVKRLTSKDIGWSEDSAKKFLNGLSAEEFSIATHIIPKLDADTSIAEIQAMIDKEMALKGLTLKLDIEVEKAKLESLSTAISESVSGVGLSSESISAIESMYSDLASYDSSKLFERTANGISLNSAELRKLNDESKKTNIAKINKQMGSLGDIYNQTREELYQLTYGTDEYNNKLLELDGIEQQIKDLEKLSAGYDGVASAYQEWQMMESAGSQRTMYEGILEGWKNVEDEISRGWVDDGTREFLELLKGEKATIIDGDGNKKEINIATASAKDLKKVWKSLDDTIKHTTYSVEDFFTVDNDGNSTSKGVYNFLDAIGQMEEEKFNGKDVVKRDKNGNIIGFDFQMVGGDKVIAEALGISEELVQIMKRASADAGFVVTLDGSFEQLDILREKAQKAAEALNKALKNKGQEDKVFSYNFNSTDEEDITKQLEKANKALNTFKKSGKIDLSIEGASEALTVTSTLQSMLDNLQRPAYMKIEVNQVEKDLQEPLRNLQELRTLTETEHQFKISGTDTSELEKSKQEIYNYFEGLDTDVKVKLGLVDDKGKPLTGQALKNKLNSGDIAIEATIDIQMEMDEKLGVLVDKALYDAGIIDKEEFTKRVNVYLEADVNNDDAKKETENAVDEVTDSEDRKQNIEIIADTFGIEDVEKLKSAMSGLTDEQVKAIAEAIGKGDVNALDSAVKGMDNNTVKAIANALGYDDVESLRNAVNKLTDNEVKATATASGETEVDSLNSSIDTLKQKDGTEIKITTFLDTIKRTFNQIASAGKKKAAQRTGADPDGFSEVNGTANVNGTTGRAFKQGAWGTKNSGTALVGELGREVLVRDGRYYTIGNNGAEFIKYKKGDIIFNHVQSEQLFKNGKVTANRGRAKAFANGTAFVGGSYPASGVAFKGDAKDGMLLPDDDSKSHSSPDKFKEVIDWIETILDRAERAIDKYEKQADNVYKTWTSRNKALNNEIVQVGNAISKYKQAETQYLAEANKVGLDEKWARKVRDGSISIDDENDFSEATYEKIKEYQEWYEKVLDCQDAIDELKEKEASLYSQRFDHVSEEYENLLQGFDHTQSMLDEYINQAEAKGYIVSKNYYNALIDNEESRISKLKEEQSALIKARDEAVTNKEFDKYSADWYRMCAEIDGVTQEIEAANTATIEWANNIREIDWQIFDLIQERISDITSEADFLIELMSNDKLFDDNGKLTDKGMATMGLHGQNYNTYMYQADDLERQIAEIDKQLSKRYDRNLEERKRELIESRYDAILAAENEKDAIKDLISEGIDAELDALQELIDKKNEALESERDLYEYQKKVKEQTKEIASLEKQMSAFSGDDSEEARAKVQQLKVDLENAKADLQETEWDKYIQDTEQILDNLYNEYDLTLNTRLDNIDALMADMIAEINANSSTISSTLSVEAANVGVMLSDAMNNIWDVGEGNAKSVLTMYGEGFQNKQTTTNTELSSIKSSVNSLVYASNKEAETKVSANKTTTSAVKNPTTSTSTPSTPSKPSEPTKVDYTGVALSIINGNHDWGNGKERERKLTEAGFNASEVQSLVNELWNDSAVHSGAWKNKYNVGDLSKYSYKNYKTGVRNIGKNQLAWTQENGLEEYIVRPSDGAILTPIARKGSVLNAQASENLWNMTNSPAEFIKDNLSIGYTNVPNNSNVNNTYTQHIDNVVFDFKNAKNYDEILAQMQKDKNFERLILSMSIDQIAGKSKLAKGKSIR